MFSQLAKRSARVLPAALCTDYAHYVKSIDQLHRRKMSTHALQKLTRDRFRAMSLAPSQKCPRNVVEMKEAMAAFFGSDDVAISCHCKRSKIILVEVLTEMCSLENIAS